MPSVDSLAKASRIRSSNSRPGVNVRVPRGTSIWYAGQVGRSCFQGRLRRRLSVEASPILRATCRLIDRITSYASRPSRTGRPF